MMSFGTASHGQVASGVSNWKAMKRVIDDRMRFWGRRIS